MGIYSMKMRKNCDFIKIDDSPQLNGGGLCELFMQK